MRVDRSFTYLQVRYPSHEELRIIKSLKDKYPDELILHLEFQRRLGRVFVSSLPLVRYRDPARLQALMDEIEAMGGQISNPHTYRLDGAGWKRTDAPQPEFKRIADRSQPDEPRQDARNRNGAGMNKRNDKKEVAS